MLASLFAFAGILVSLEGLRLHILHRIDPKRKAWCDFSAYVNCTKALSSRYGNLFLLPNPVWGLLYYISLIVALFLDMTVLVQISAIVGVMASVFLAYLLFFRVKSACVLCLATYAFIICIAITVF